MARIYKESRYVLQLLIGKSYVAQYDDVKISFYTKNPNNQVMVDDGITIKRNIAEVKIESTLFDNLEEGLISYIVYGTKDSIPFIEERQSNYFLKTPLDSNNPGDIKATILEATITENGTYNFKPKTDAYLNPIEKWEGATITVDVPPKINVKEAGVKFRNSTFAEVPEWADFDGITDMSYMFSDCGKLQTIPEINTSNVTNMSDMFYECVNLKTIPMIDTSNVTNMHYMFYHCINLQTIPLLNTSKVTNMNNIFSYCHKLQTIPQIDTSSAIDMIYMFHQCTSLVSIPALNAQSLSMPSYWGVFGYVELPKITDFGGFLNLKCSLTDDTNLKRLPNLTYESCINVLNGLYDFTGNGETPGSNQGQLKVHQNFLDAVGEEISIGTNKGWTITV